MQLSSRRGNWTTRILDCSYPVLFVSQTVRTAPELFVPWTIRPHHYRGVSSCSGYLLSLILNMWYESSSDCTNSPRYEQSVNPRRQPLLFMTTPYTSFTYSRTAYSFTGVHKEKAAVDFVYQRRVVQSTALSARTVYRAEPFPYITVAIPHTQLIYCSSFTDSSPNSAMPTSPRRP